MGSASAPNSDMCWAKLFAEEFRQAAWKAGSIRACPNGSKQKFFFTWKSLSFGLGGHTTHSASPLTWRWKEANHAFQSRYLSRSWFGISCKGSFTYYISTLGGRGGWPNAYVSKKHKLLKLQEMKQEPLNEKKQKKKF